MPPLRHGDSSRFDPFSSGLITGVAASVAALSIVWISSRQWRFLCHQWNHPTEPIYLDYNGTTPVYASVLQAMLPYFQAHYGNPGSSHALGDAPKRAVQMARRQILKHLLGCSIETEASDTGSKQPSSPSSSTPTPESACVFTACGTESNNLAIHWALQHYRANHTGHERVPHIVTSNVEHPAIDACLAAHERAGTCTVTRVAVRAHGRVEASDILAAIQPHRTALVTLMLANNETGALQPVQAVAEYCRARGILMATDAAQAVGKVSIRLDDLGHPDMVTMVGHKFGAPKGIACLYVRPGCLDSHNMTGLLIGGGQEGGRRAGTENVPYMVGMGHAAELCARTLDETARHLEDMRTLLISRLQDELGVTNVHIHGPTDPTERLPNTLSVALLGCQELTPQPIQASRLLDAIRHDVAASAGAACHSADAAVSTVLQALQISDDVARATIRLSVGPHTTRSHIHRAAHLLAHEVRRQCDPTR